MDDPLALWSTQQLEAVARQSPYFAECDLHAWVLDELPARAKRIHRHLTLTEADENPGHGIPLKCLWQNGHVHREAKTAAAQRPSLWHFIS